MTFSIMTFYIFNIFLFSTAFILPNAPNPFNTFTEAIGVSSQGLPGSGTVSGATPETIQASRGAAISCGGGIIGGAIAGAAIGAWGAGVGAIPGALVGALFGGIVGCALIPSNPSLTAQIAGAVDNTGLGAFTDALATFGVIMRWVGAFITFVTQLAGYGFMLFAVDQVIGPYLSMVNALFIGYMIFIIVNLVRGRGG